MTKNLEKTSPPEAPKSFTDKLKALGTRIKESAFGATLTKAKEILEKRPAPPQTETTEETTAKKPAVRPQASTAENHIDRAAENLANASEEIEIDETDTNNPKIKIKLNREKIPNKLGTNQPLTAGELFTPDVSKFTIRLDNGTEVVAERRQKGDVWDYYYKDQFNTDQRLDLKGKGTVLVLISEDDMLDKTRDEVEKMMKEDVKRAVTVNVKKELKQESTTPATTLATQPHPDDAQRTSHTPTRINSPARTGGTGRSSPTQSQTAPASGDHVTEIPVTPRTSARSPETNTSAYTEYLAHSQRIKEKYNPSPVSIIPETPTTAEIPKKPAGTIRMVVFGDTDPKDKEGQDHSQQNLATLQQMLPQWEADFALGVGDFIDDRGRTPEQYKERVKKAREEFRKFGATRYALALGNHDREGAATDDLTDLYKTGLENYEEVEGAYSYTLGGATFVVLNEGNKVVTEKQVEFFRKKSLEAKGAVYFINHIPPYQDAYGAGLPNPPDQPQGLKNFQEIQTIAKENIESKGRPFYVISGHTHFSHVIGNFMNPGGMGANYFALPGEQGKRMQSQRSAAVVDIDAQTGAIKAVYFRSAESGFKSPLGGLQDALAWGRAQVTPEQPDTRVAGNVGAVLPPATPQNLQEQQPSQEAGKRVIDATTARIESDEKNRSCWTVCEQIYQRAGMTKKSLYKAKYKGVDCGNNHAGPKELSLITPGDWLFINNQARNPVTGQTYSRSGNHSVIFVRWIDRKNLIAEVASGGSNTHPRLHRADLKKTPVTLIYKPVQDPSTQQQTAQSATPRQMASRAPIETPNDEDEDEGGPPPTEISNKKRQPTGTNDIPYQFIEATRIKNPQTNKDIVITNGGAPGRRTPKKDETGKRIENFNHEMAESQIRALYNRGIRVIVSLDAKKSWEMPRVISKLKKEGLDIDFIKASYTCNADPEGNNLRLFEQVGARIKNGKSIYIHCMHGAHRAPSCTAGALIAAGVAKSFAHALQLAKLDPVNFREKNGDEDRMDMIRQIARFAKSKGLKVETTQEYAAYTSSKNNVIEYANIIAKV